MGPIPEKLRREEQVKDLEECSSPRACGWNLSFQPQGPLCCFRPPFSPPFWQFLCLSPASESTVTHAEA